MAAEIRKLPLSDREKSHAREVWSGARAIPRQASRQDVSPPVPPARHQRLRRGPTFRGCQCRHTAARIVSNSWAVSVHDGHEGPGWIFQSGGECESSPIQEWIGGSQSTRSNRISRLISLGLTHLLRYETSYTSLDV